MVESIFRLSMEVLLFQALVVLQTFPIWLFYQTER